MNATRILILTPQLPYPPHQGTTIRNYNLIVNLAARHEVHLLSFVHSRDELAAAHPLRRHCASVEVALVPRRSPLKRLLSVLLSPQPDMALRLPSAEFGQKLDALLSRQAFDVVQVEGIELAPYLFQAAARRQATGERGPLIVFDDHNAEYVLQQRAFETDVRHPRRWVGALYSLIQWQKLRGYEIAACRRADRVVACSDADRDALRRLMPDLDVTIIPNGVDVAHYSSFSAPPSTLGSPLPLVFTGKMDFRPNVDAVLWFAHEVLPLIRAEVPEAHFYVVGQKPHRRLAPLAENPAVTLTGYVDDVRPYIAAAAVYVVPLRIGGGTRLKIMEAMAMSKAIVSTSLGCEGFPLTPGRELIVADAPQDFARQVVSLWRDPAARERLGRAGRRFVEKRYDWPNIVPLFEQVYE